MSVQRNTFIVARGFTITIGPREADPNEAPQEETGRRKRRTEAATDRAAASTFRPEQSRPPKKACTWTFGSGEPLNFAFPRIENPHLHPRATQIRARQQSARNQGLAPPSFRLPAPSSGSPFLANARALNSSLKAAIESDTDTRVPFPIALGTIWTLRSVRLYVDGENAQAFLCVIDQTEIQIVLVTLKESLLKSGAAIVWMAKRLEQYARNPQPDSLRPPILKCKNLAPHLDRLRALTKNQNQEEKIKALKIFLEENPLLHALAIEYASEDERVRLDSESEFASILEMTTFFCDQK